MDNLNIDEDYRDKVSSALFEITKITIDRLIGLRTADEDGIKRGTSKFLRDRFMAKKSKARLVFDQYVLLESDQMKEFFELLGEASVAEVPWTIVNCLSAPEKERYAEFSVEMYATVIHPALVKHAVDAAASLPNATLDEIKADVDRRFRESTDIYHEAISKLEREKLEAKRNRKPSLENIKRNVEICDLRLKGWSQGQIAKKYGKTDTWVRNIEREELKWRRLLAQAAEPSS